MSNIDDGLHYYTARQINSFTYEVTKWSSARAEPLDTYRLAQGSWTSCTCPSPKNPCKHRKMLDAIRAHATDTQNWVHLSVTEDLVVHTLEGL